MEKNTPTMLDEDQTYTTMTSMSDDSNNHSTDGNNENENWEPINTEIPSDLSLFQRKVSLQLDELEHEAKEADHERAKEIEGILQTVDELILQAEDDSSIGSNDAPSVKEKRRESRLKMRRRLHAARNKIQQGLKSKLVKPVARASVNATRRVITGNKKTRIRDFVVMPNVVRVLDRYTFTGGIMGMLLTEFIMLQFPHLFRYYNVVTMLPLLLLRVVLFHRTKQQYFLLDYCYWVNSLGFALAFLKNYISLEYEQILWQVLFVSANGPLFFAMIAWNNSLVFHSVDKVTSTYVHLFPALLCWCERWQSTESAIYNTTTLPWSHHLGYPLLFYSLWQAVYLIQTEWWHRETLDADPDLSTSLRYLSSAHKMSINRLTLVLCRKVGIMGPTETFDPPTFKVKVIFVALQMVMTVCTYMPVRWMYQYYTLHTFIVLGILTFSVYNGARYYIQVFSKIFEKRYHDGGPEEEYVDTGAVMSEHKKSK